MKDFPALYGSKVFSEAIMKKMLPSPTYIRLREAILEGKTLDLDVANVVANAMKGWAIDHGATHFTHWFQPMTGITAEKHESFISVIGDGTVITEFSGKELIKGDTDASSFPSGGIRATFEARGYTAWDPSSYAFIKEGTLCIPTAFASYTGEALDKKTPLLRSMQALDLQARRILRLFGDTQTKRVTPSVGAEQEYFLVDKELYEKRKDLLYCGRTLFGAKPPKGQEMEAHYYGALKSRVTAFMRDLDEALWEIGIPAKTEHNETAPAQHELAPIYREANVATDHNQLIMEFMKKIAAKHGMACLLHEKPFRGINGSGKHNNFSLETDSGTNLLDPGATPSENVMFLLCLVAIIKAVDDYQGLLRMTVSNAGNDHRLGAHEAPPAIISIFLGDEITKILFAIEAGEEYVDSYERIMELGAKILPNLPKETTDRNRTSPFAFTGNKFEFRMVGSSMSISGPNIALNTALAESFCQFADILEASEDFNRDLIHIISKEIREHKRIIFNGDNYSDEWKAEAARRGLKNMRSTPEALPEYLSEKTSHLFTKHKVLSETEQRARYDIKMQEYVQTLEIEAATMAEMINKDILPAVSRYKGDLAYTINNMQENELKGSIEYEASVLSEISELSSKLYNASSELKKLLEEINSLESIEEKAGFTRDKAFFKMEEARQFADSLELLIPRSYWPMPTYGDLFYSV
ncbi:MAG: glutamine synthetase III [Eubacteriaceae bacterium]|nr:glutamine synthetase III [Eubacteriaceae bacterium]